jgi:hypothetical protein
MASIAQCKITKTCGNKYFIGFIYRITPIGKLCAFNLKDCGSIKF